VILRLEDENGGIGFGEIAPLTWFGTESLAHAKVFCNNLDGQIEDDRIRCIGEGLPCCQFAFESACSMIRNADESKTDGKLGVTALLSSGSDALDQLPKLLDQGYRSFKWKIGVRGLNDEKRTFEHLVHKLPEDGRLRLDANCRLLADEADAWLQLLESYEIEFLEQPLGPDSFDRMCELAEKYKTPIALDESVADRESLREAVASGWKGVVVVKPSILGSIDGFLEWVESCPCRIVFSTVFETVVGKSAGLKLALKASAPEFAVGYGVHHFFPDDDVLASPRFSSPSIDPYEATLEDFEGLWSRIVTD